MFILLAVVRVHKALRRKGKSWKSGQKIKILKGACAGFHNNNVYATLEYILLEGFQGDAGGKLFYLWLETHSNPSKYLF